MISRLSSLNCQIENSFIVRYLKAFLTHQCWACSPSVPPWLRRSPWSPRYIQALLSLVELIHYCALIGREPHRDDFFSLWRYASSLMPLKTSSRYPKHFFPFVGSLWHKDRWLPCTEIIYCRAYRSNITTQPKKGKPGYLPEVLHHVLHYEPPLPLGEAGGEVTGEADPNCLTGITKQRLELLSSYWSS